MKMIAKLALAAVLLGTSAFAGAAHAEDAAKVVELQDGTKVTVKGEEVFVEKDGAEVAAPDGEHTTKDGEVIVVKGGKIVK